MKRGAGKAKRKGRRKSRKSRGYYGGRATRIPARVLGLGSSSINATREMIQEALPGLSKAKATRLAKSALRAG